MKVNFVSAEGSIWEGEAEYVSVFAIDGAMGIMACAPERGPRGDYRSRWGEARVPGHGRFLLR